MLRTIYYALTPLFILLAFSLFSAVLSYFIMLIIGDVISIRKIISKAAQILLLLSIFPMRRYLQLTWSDIGFAPKAIFFKQVYRGFGLGLLTLLPVMITLFCLDISVIDTTREWTSSKVVIRISLALLLALLISFGEEPIFSGLLLAGLRKKIMIPLAAYLSAGYYATFHFVKTKTDIPYEEISIGSSLQLVKEAFLNVFNSDILPAFTSLLIVGLFLIVIRTQYKHSIGVCIGCHAAWVWQIKIGKDFFNTNLDSDYAYLVSSYDGIIGPLVSFWLLLTLMGYFFWQRKK
ncbi:MAG: CPBP family intramembrane metalloprotease [Methylococcales bacterium]|nr:CPBP family intramembrane metalloprotease [Methylococcales bacterium]